MLRFNYFMYYILLLLYYVVNVITGAIFIHMSYLNQKQVFKTLTI